MLMVKRSKRSIHLQSWLAEGSSGQPKIYPGPVSKLLVQDLLGHRNCDNTSESNATGPELSGNLPLYPVPSGSTWAAATLPSTTLRAYLLPRTPPKMAVPSNPRSRAFVKAAEGSARNRICKNPRTSVKGQLTIGG